MRRERHRIVLSSSGERLRKHRTPLYSSFLLLFPLASSSSFDSVAAAFSSNGKAGDSEDNIIPPYYRDQAGLLVRLFVGQERAETGAGT
jgi:hypothetical protein